MEKTFAAFGAISGFIAVLAGAFGAHMLKEKLSPDMLSVFEVGVRYQMYHAFALFIVAFASLHWPALNFARSGWCFVAGTVLFSGSLYALALTGIRILGAITPLGGLFFLAGWVFLAASLLKN